MTVDRSSMVGTPILIFMIYGFWCPLWWSSKWKIAYYCYSVIAYILLVTHMLTQLFNIIFNINYLTDLAGHCLSLMPTIDAFAKATNIFLNRRKIIALLNMFESDRCKVQNYREMKIQQKCQTLFRRINVTSIILYYLTIIYLLVKPFILNVHARELPFLAWYPYTVDTEISFWSTYAYEVLSSPIVAFVDLASVLLAISLMGQISAQLDILADRLTRLAGSNIIIRARKSGISADLQDATDSRPEERRRKLVDCVNHHLFIFELAEATQRCFVPTFFSQMLASLVGIGAGAYQLARYSVGSPEFNSAALFVACLMVLSFPCCWFGNEVYLKSLEVGNAVYKTNWINLEKNFQKDLLNICMRAKRPIIFTSGPTLPLSNSVFMGILQCSYTAFTVLQRIDSRASSSSVPVEI